MLPPSPVATTRASRGVKLGHLYQPPFISGVCCLGKIRIDCRTQRLCCREQLGGAELTRRIGHLQRLSSIRPAQSTFFALPLPPKLAALA